MSGGATKRARPAEESGDAGSSSSKPIPIFTVYLEGLPYSSSEDDIRELFIGCGEILAIRAPRYQDSGRLMGYAHVDFGTKAEATKALAKNGQHVGGRYVKIAVAKPVGAGADSLMAFSERPRPKGCSTLFVKGLPYECDEDAVKAAFARFGAVSSVRLARWNHTERLKGFGYVAFEHGFSAEAAVKAYREGLGAGAGGKKGEPVTVGGRTVHLDYETGAPKGSFKTSEGQSFWKKEEAAPLKKALLKAEHGVGAAASSSAAAGGAGAASAAAGASKKSSKSKAAARDEEDEGSDGGDERPKRSSGSGRGDGEAKSRSGAKTAVAPTPRKRAASADADDDGSDGDDAGARAAADRGRAAKRARVAAPEDGGDDDGDDDGADAAAGGAAAAEKSKRRQRKRRSKKTSAAAAADDSGSGSD